MEQIVNKIKQNIEELFQEESFRKEAINKDPKTNNILIINNSFVNREKANSVKSSKYLAIKYSDNNSFGGFFIQDKYQAEQNKAVKWEAIDESDLLSLDAEIYSEVSELGTIVYALISIPQQPDIVSTVYDKEKKWFFEWDPNHRGDPAFIDNYLKFNDLLNIDSIWAAFVKYLFNGNKPDSQAEAKFFTSLKDLYITSTADLLLPNDSPIAHPNLLESMIESIKINLRNYQTAYTAYKSEDLNEQNVNFTEMLRIAYNFTSDLEGLFLLILDLFDNKPVIGWAALKEHYLFAQAIDKITQNHKNKKADLREYKKIIHSARNQKFHKILNIQSTLIFRPPDSTINKPTIKLFSEFSKKNDNALDYKDKWLLDNLLTFTRTNFQRAPLEIWEQNALIMQRTIDLLSVVNNTIKDLYKLNYPKN